MGYGDGVGVEFGDLAAAGVLLVSLINFVAPCFKGRTSWGFIAVMCVLLLLKHQMWVILCDFDIINNCLTLLR